MTTDRCTRPGLLAACAGLAFTLSAGPAMADDDSAPDAAAAQVRAAQDLPSLDRSLYRLSVVWENDGGVIRPGGTDRHYTNGVLVSFAHQPAWADGLADGLGLDHTATAAGYHAGHQMFTPEDLTRVIPDPTDRPYAGYLFAGVFWQREQGNQLDHIQLDFGVVGPSSGADDLQDWVHEWFDGQDPQGWDSQLGDEFTYQLTYRHKWRIPLDNFRPFKHDVDWQLIPQAGFGVGNVYRQADLAVTLRVGQFLADDFGPSSIADLASATGLTRQWQAQRDGRLPGFRWSLFGTARVRFVEHNMFLDGPDGEPGPAVDSEPIVGEFGGGVELLFRMNDRWSLDLSYANTFLTDEFEGQDELAAFATLNVAIRATW